MPHLRFGLVEWVCYNKGYGWVRLPARPKRQFKFRTSIVRLPVIEGGQTTFGGRKTSQEASRCLRKGVGVLVLVEKDENGKERPVRIAPSDLWDRTLTLEAELISAVKPFEA